jgi:hypothetical protein
MMSYATQHQLGGANRIDTASKVFGMIMPAAGLSDLYSISWDGNPPVCKAFVLAVGHKKQTGELKITSKETIERVKEVLGEHNDPSCYEMY